MSDFVADGWSVFVAVTTVVGLLACLALLVIASRRKVMATDNTTGHVWDEDLRELNHPLPRWWMGLFVLTVLFAGLYLVLYPGLGSFAGLFHWTSQQQFHAEQAHAQASMQQVYARFHGRDAQALAQDAEAMAIGERLFAHHCAQCHGADAKGSRGFPDLTDGDWLYGGDHRTLMQTIAEGRAGLMPPMADAVGGSTEMRQLAHYVLSLSGSPHNAVWAALGKPKFAACAACHGVGGKGNQALGAPNLTDNVWLHGWGEAAIVEAIQKGRHNTMPAHASRLSPDQIRVLAAYVWKLSPH